MIAATTVMLAALQVAARAPATVTVEGRAERVVAGDTSAAAGARIDLHRVGPTTQGVIDSAVAGADGGFAFRARVDSGDVLLVSARWEGVEYFAAPVNVGTPVEVTVVDTSSVAAVTIAARHVIIGGPAADGTRDVVDLVILRNGSGMTRVGGGAGMPAFRMPTPPRVANLRIGDGDFAPEAFEHEGDALKLLAPIPPGDRQFFLEYQLPPGARALELPLQPPPDTLSILAEEQGMQVPTSLSSAGTEQMVGGQFTRWSGRPGTGTLRIGMPGARNTPRWLLPLLVALVAIPLLLVTRRALLPRGAR